MIVFLKILLLSFSVEALTLTRDAKPCHNSTSPCSRIGSSCSLDCLEIGFCTKVGGPLMNPHDCDKDQFCLNSKSEEIVPECRPKQFCSTNPAINIVCVKPGEIPNPFDISQFFVCDNADDQFCVNEAKTCPTGYWDLDYKRCEDLPVNPREIVDCDPPDGLVDLNSDSKFVYQCLGEDIVYVYDKTNVFPDDPNEPGTPNDPNEPGTPNDPNGPGTPNDPNEPGNPATDCAQVKPPSNLFCTRPNILYPMDGRPCCYWKCDANVGLTPKSCLSGYAFVATRDGCVPDTSGVCK